MGTKWTWKFASIAMGLITLRVEWMCSVSAVELSRSPLLTDNTTVSVSNLSVNISNQGCNNDKVCFSKPKNCNPAQDTSCFFLSIRVATTNSSNCTFELFGKSSDYIGVGLLLNKMEGIVTVFACPNKNGSLVVNYTTLSNSTLTQNNSDSANASLIQCVFTINGLKGAWDLMNQTYDVFLILGSFTNGSLGSKRYQTDLQKLVNEPSTPPSNTTSMAITSSSGNFHPSNTSAMMSSTTTISANMTNVSSSQASSESMGSNAPHHIANKVTLILCSAIVSVLL